MSCSCPNRRTALQAGGALLATGSLAACGGGDPAAEGGGADGRTGGATDGAEGAGSGERLRAPLADTPVGGSTYYESEEIIVTRPTEDQVLAFDATCTHAGCMVSGTGDDGTLVCPCHNSVFAADSGDVVSGPATQPLAAVDAEVDGADVVISG